MIKELTEKVNKKTKERVMKLNHTPKLLVVNLDGSKANNIYTNSLIRGGEEVGIEVIPIPYYELYKEEYKNEKVLLLKPSKEEYKNLYKYVLHNLGTRSLEPKGIQYPTIKAITNIINKIGKNQNVLIIGRSRALGRPLADILLDIDHTVMMVHTKTVFHHTTYWDTVVNLADIDLLGVGTAFVIDAADSLKATEQGQIINGIGKLTTAYALDEVIF